MKINAQVIGLLFVLAGVFLICLYAIGVTWNVAHLAWVGAASCFFGLVFAELVATVTTKTE